jgi:hypothetical protein
VFNKDIFYSPNQEKVEGQPLKIVQSLVKIIKEKANNQDAGSILQNLRLWDIELNEQNNNTMANLRDISGNQESLLIIV